MWVWLTFLLASEKDIFSKYEPSMWSSDLGDNMGLELMSEPDDLELDDGEGDGVEVEANENDNDDKPFFDTHPWVVEVEGV